MPAPNAVARPYARAAFAKALGDGALADWSEFLRQLTVLVENADMRRLLKTPRIDTDSVLRVIHAVLKPPNGGMDNFLTLLARRRRLTCLPVITSLYEELRKREEGMVAARVQTAHALTGEQEKSLQSRLADYFSAGVVMDTQVNPALIGGIRIHVGDRVWDASVRGCLQRLARRLAVQVP